MSFPFIFMLPLRPRASNGEGVSFNMLTEPLAIRPESLQGNGSLDASASQERLAALGEHLVSLETWLRKYIERRLGGFPVGGVESDDVLQDTYCKAVGALPEFEPRGKTPSPYGGLRTWLGRIVENHLCDLIRRERRFASLVGRAPDAAADRVLRADDRDAARSAGLLERVIAPSPSPVDLAVDHEAVECLRACLAELPEPHRQVVCLKLLKGKTTAEISASLGPSPAAVRMLFGRGLEKLTTRVQQKYGRDVSAYPSG